MEPRPSQPRSGSRAGEPDQSAAGRTTGARGATPPGRDLGRPERSSGAGAFGSGRPADPRFGAGAGSSRPPAPPGTGGAGWIPPTVPPATSSFGSRPSGPASPFPNPTAGTGAYPSTYPSANPSPASAPNPYVGAPAAVPPSEYGPVRDIYDPSFAAAQFGGALAQEGVTRDVPAARLTGLEPRISRRRRAILSGIATALAVVLVVGLIAFAVWQTQQGDDGGEAARAGAGTPPVAPASGGDQSQASGAGDEAVAAGDVAGGAGEAARRTPAAGDEPTAEDDTEARGAATDEEGEQAADDEAAAAGEDRTGAGDDAAAGDEPTPTPSQSGRSLASLVPADDEIPRDFVLTAEGKWDQQTVAGAFSNPEAASAQLDAWGWRGSQFRQLERSPDAPPVGGATTFLVVSVHRFDSADSADEALTYFADEVIAVQGLEPVETEPLGDEVIVLAGDPDDATLVVLYVRTGPYLIRIGGASPDGNPLEDVVDLAEVILVNESDDRADRA